HPARHAQRELLIADALQFLEVASGYEGAVTGAADEHRMDVPVGHLGESPVELRHGFQVEGVAGLRTVDRDRRDRKPADDLHPTHDWLRYRRTRMPDEPGDECPFPKPFPDAFEACRAYRPRLIFPTDTGSHPLSP